MREILSASIGANRIIPKQRNGVQWLVNVANLTRKSVTLRDPFWAESK